MTRLYRLIVPAMIVFSMALPFVAVMQDDATPTVEVTLAPTVEPTPVIVEPPPPNPIPEDPTEPPATTPETLLGQLFALLKDGTYIVWAAAGVLIIVGALKTVFGLFGIGIANGAAVLLTLVVQVLVWLGYAIANYFGQGDTFKATYLQVMDVLRALLPLAGSIFLGHVGYQAARKRNVPILGYKFVPPGDRPQTNVKSVRSGPGASWAEPPPREPHE